MASASWTQLEGPLDTSVRLATPERIVFAYPLAGPFHRVSAYLLDLVVIAFLYLVAILVPMVVSLGSISGLGLAFVAYFVITWGYGIVCEASFNGQTLGKRVVGIRVVSDQGVPLTGAQAVLRNLVGTFDGLIPFWYMLGLATMLLTRRFQRLGDLAAGTMVVVEQRRGRAGVERVVGPEVEAVLPWLPVRVPAGSELARALSDYVAHRTRLSPAQRAEMAEPLARPLRARYRLPVEAPADSVLCAMYHRVFLGE
jgi:uncharacterized RDD family membrane protein YckC